MIKITNLTMKNFLSVGNVTSAVNLDKHGLTLVLGANTDTNGGLTRNGAGKTTILQAISFALYGKPLSRIKIPNLINNINGKQMLVTIEFERDGRTYRIERGRKPDVMKFYVNNQQVKDDDEDTGSELGENRHTQTEIERIVGMSHTLFKHIVALNTYTEPFLRMKADEQRKVIEELLGVMQISAKADELRKLISGTKEAIRDQQANIRAFTESNTRIEAKIAETEALSYIWVSKHDKAISQLLEEIAAMESIDYDAEITKFDELDAWLLREREIRASLEQANREIDYLSRERAAHMTEALRFEREAAAGSEALISRAESEKTRKASAADRMLSERTTRETTLAKLQSDLANVDAHTCVSCDQSLVGTDHLAKVVANIEAQIAKAVEAITFNARDHAALLADIAVIDTEIAAMKLADETKRVESTAKAAQKRLEADKLLPELGEHQTQSEASGALLKALPPKPDLIFTSRDEVYSTKGLFDGLKRDLENEGAKVDPNLAQIEMLKSTLQEVDYGPLNDLDDLLKHQDFVLKLLTSKDSFIRKKIIDQNLAYLNGRLETYLDKLGLPHKVQFMSDLSVEITLLGRDFDFEQLSRGEMNRVIMATSWSFRDMWESLNESFNLLFVDEMLDQGTDAQGVEAALSILKGMARANKNIFLISHRDDLTSRIDRVLMVHKENGFTRFEEDAAA